MTWSAVLGLGVAAYALKAVGPVVLGRRMVRPDLAQVLELFAVPLLAALVLVQTFGGGGGRLVLDARAPALCVAALLVWRRAPFLVVVLSAAGTAALLRAAL